MNRRISDTQAMELIHSALNNESDWSADTLNHIADIVRVTGRTINESEVQDDSRSA